MVDTDKHLDLKRRLKSMILDMELHSMLFTQDEIIEHAVHAGLEEEEVREMINELIIDKYIHEVPGTEGPLLSRTVWRDYSPANEERPEV